MIILKKPKKKTVWISDAAWAELPDELLILEFSVEGTVYVTTLMDAKTYPKKSLAELYQQRWQIEVGFRSIKTHMGMEMLRCKTAEMVNRRLQCTSWPITLYAQILPGLPVSMTRSHVT